MNVVDRFKLDGKTALVTGAGQGLGRAFAHGLAEAGANVAIVDINADNASKVASEIKAIGRKSLMIKADTSKHSDAYDMVEQVISAWGRLDITVNNVGVALDIKDVTDVTEQDWDRILNINLRGTFFCAQAEAKAMIPNGYGKIINIASICGYIVWPRPQALYSISKAGIIHLTRCLAAEWIKYGIRVNSISPGVTRTPDLFEDVPAVFLNKAPIDRIAEVEDLQGAVLYLASEVSDFMTGHDMVIDGGYTII
ncbi:MAG: SDR family NAD(P)-dependent oxidoreductase [Sedimentisphaerales bacterium]